MPDNIVTDTAAPAALPGEEAYQDPLLQSSLRFHEVCFALGPELQQLVDGDGLVRRIPTLRRLLAEAYGFLLPPIPIVLDPSLAPRAYRITVHEAPAAEGEVVPGKLLVLMNGNGPCSVEGTDTFDPAFAVPARWIEPAERGRAQAEGFTVVDALAVLITHLQEVVKRHMPLLLSYATTRRLLEGLPEEHHPLVNDVVPARASVFTVQRVLQTLLEDGVSIRNLPVILEGIGEMAPTAQGLIEVTEHVRRCLGFQITRALADASGAVPVVQLSDATDALFRFGPGGQPGAPVDVATAIVTLRRRLAEVIATGTWPLAVLTSVESRPYVRAVLLKIAPEVAAISKAELQPDTRLRDFGTI